MLFAQTQTLSEKEQMIRDKKKQCQAKFARCSYNELVHRRMDHPWPRQNLDHLTQHKSVSLPCNLQLRRLFPRRKAQLARVSRSHLPSRKGTRDQPTHNSLDFREHGSSSLPPSMSVTIFHVSLDMRHAARPTAHETSIQVRDAFAPEPRRSPDDSAPRSREDRHVKMTCARCQGRGGVDTKPEC